MYGILPYMPREDSTEALQAVSLRIMGSALRSSPRGRSRCAAKPAPHSDHDGLLYGMGTLGRDAMAPRRCLVYRSVLSFQF